MYVNGSEALHSLFDVLEATSEGELYLADLARLVRQVPALGYRIRHQAASRVQRKVPLGEAVVLLGERGVSREARALLRHWAPTGLLNEAAHPFDSRRPLTDVASDRDYRAAS